jgi:hypothetical protein
MLTLFPEPSDDALVEKLKALNDYYGFEHSVFAGLVFDFLAVLSGARASFKTIGEYAATIGDYEGIYLMQKKILIVISARYPVKENNMKTSKGKKLLNYGVAIGSMKPEAFLLLDGPDSNSLLGKRTRDCRGSTVSIGNSTLWIGKSSDS